MSDVGIPTCHSGSISPVIRPDDGEVPSQVMSPVNVNTVKIVNTVKTVKTEVPPALKARSSPSVSQGQPVDNMQVQAELASWVRSVLNLEEQKPLGEKYRTFIPLRWGSKAVESHSMHERGLTVRGQEDLLKTHHGSGEVVFSNGDIYSGQFVDGLRHGQGLVRIKKELMRNIIGEMVDSKVSFIEGSFVADKLEGPGMVSSD